MTESPCAASSGDRYAVMGNPVAHSKSPLIHRLFARQTGDNLCYEALLVSTGGLAPAVAGFLGEGGKGLNITVPFKQDACRIADTLSDRARRAGAVNTLRADPDGRLFGDNTDGIGLIRDLTQNLGLQLEGANILLLGAGGAARGVLAPVLEQQPATLHIANRTVERAAQLAGSFADLGNLSASGFDDIPARRYDIIVNATAAGLHGTTPALPAGTIGPLSRCYDMMYGTEPTPFMRYAHQHGCRHTCDGLGMLVEQAAESFRLWRGVRPETAAVLAALRAN
jgi:shikimate dehydrogenase